MWSSIFSQRPTTNEPTKSRWVLLGIQFNLEQRCSVSLGCLEKEPMSKQTKKSRLKTSSQKRFFLCLHSRRHSKLDYFRDLLPIFDCVDCIPHLFVEGAVELPVLLRKGGLHILSEFRKGTCNITDDTSSIVRAWSEVHTSPALASMRPCTAASQPQDGGAATRSTLVDRLCLNS